MPRKKVNLQWISNDTSRRVTHKKRCKALMKKTSELTTLCGVKACVVVYGEGEAQPEVWPSASEARDVLEKFKDMPEIGRFKKTQNQEDFIQGRISKLREQVCKLDLVNREHETSRLLLESMEGRRPGLVGTNVEELTNLNRMVEEKMAKVKELLHQQVVREGAVPSHPVLSSSQPQASYTYTEMQALVESVELQQGWPTNLAPNNAFANSSNGCADTSENRGDMTQAYGMGCFSGLGTQDVFPPME
ncbi:hypothetical protein HU200_055600 [Digitaria exilis]|uniref:MADS-box domain-containing protein n=1 Tax=Digitaria exilis TaxID=1010633 RepID=A0A835AII7_9POAL|nr:hypothetical protein HU200_055600 [Digitaria exilis]CAB3472092.1 unnamed protein product [Digitaria exilis]